MTCNHCGKEITTMADYYTRTRCKDCYNAYMREYMATYSKTEKYKKWHREYWKGGKILVKSNSTWE